MDISGVINSFNSYLEDLNENSNKNYNTSSASSSIFMYSTEFKNYLVDELNTDTSVFSKSINEILEMDVVNGKFVETEDSAETTESQEYTFTDVINSFFEQDEVKNIVDADYNGELSENEMESFLNIIKGYDGDSEDISLEDLISVMEQIENGTFTLNTETETVPEDSYISSGTETAANAAQTQPTSTAGTSGTSGTSGTAGTAGTSGTSTASASTETTKKNLDGMSEDELQSELTTAQSDLSDKQAVLSAIFDGSNSELQALQGNIDDAYDIYLEQLENVDEVLAGRVDDLNSTINGKEDEIDAKDQEISNQECAVSDAETSYNNAVSTRENLESSLASLETADTSEYDSEKLSDYNSQISQLETKISEAEKAEDTAKTAWDEAKEKLENLEGDRENLQTDLDDLNEQMSELEAEILEKYPEIEEYLNAYNNAKEEYNTTKESLTAQAKAEVSDAQDYVNEVQTALNNYDNKEIENSYSDSEYDAEAGERLVEYAKQMLETYGSSSGYCATGVSRTFAMAYGLDLHGNGCDWDTNMEDLVEQGLFIEVTSDYVSSDELANLPAGAVVCWEATTGTGGGGSEYGHVTIADGNGGEISDHYAENIYTSIGGSSDTYRVFLPA